MPLDVETTSGSSDKLAGLPTAVLPQAGDDVVRFLSLNLLDHPGKLFPVLPSARPNPGSEKPWAPWTNVATPLLGEAARTLGQFIVTAETTKQFEFAPNYNLRITEGITTVNVDVRSPNGTTTYWQDPRKLASEIRAELRASALPSASTYDCIFDDDRNSTAPTFKWTVKNTAGVNFTMTGKPTDANSVLPSIGFPSASYSGASTYTGAVAIHTEESAVLDLNWFPDSAVTTATRWGVGGTESTSRYRWLVLILPNLTGSGGAAGTAGDPKLHVYLGTTLASVDNQPDSAYIEDRTFFRLGKASSLGNDEWSDGPGYVAPVEATPSVAFPAGRFLVDLKGWRARFNAGADAYAPNHRYMHLKVVNPANPAGSIQVGYAYVGPGWYPERPLPHSDDRTPRDRSEVAESPYGHVLSRYRDVGDALEAAWTRSDGGPITENDEHFIRHVLLGPRMTSMDNAGVAITADAAGRTHVPNKRTAAGRARPIVVIDPSYVPAVVGASARKALGMSYGLVEVGRLTRMFNDQYGATLRLVGVPR